MARILTRHTEPATDKEPSMPVVYSPDEDDYCEMKPLPMPQEREVTTAAKIESVQADDLEHYQMILAGLRQCWNRPFLSVDSVCKLAITTNKVLEARRSMLFPGTFQGPKKLTAYDA